MLGRIPSLPEGKNTARCNQDCIVPNQWLRYFWEANSHLVQRSDDSFF